MHIIPKVHNELQAEQEQEKPEEASDILSTLAIINSPSAPHSTLLIPTFLS